MTKKILLCAVSVWALACVPSLAGDAKTHAPNRFSAPTHWAPPHGAARQAPRAAVVRGYYPGRYGAIHQAFRPSSYAFAPTRHGYGNFRYTYGENYLNYSPSAPAYAAYAPTAALSYAPPTLAYRNVLAYVPVTTYAPVPVRIYYVPQQQPYYNVPPYAVPDPCMCN